MNQHDNEKLEQVLTTPEDFVAIQPLIDPVVLTNFSIVHKSVFDIPADAFVNTINCVGVMGAGIALEFKNRYPKMFTHYKDECKKHHVRPGDCYTYWDEEHHVWLLGLAVKDDWRHWGTLEWIESSIKSLKLAVLENDIKSVNLPLLGGKNGRRGPYGKVPGFTPPPDREELKSILRLELQPFADKFGVDIKLCIPDEVPKKVQPDLTQFLEL